MERRTITPGFVEDALDCLHRRGLDPAPLLARAGIDPALGDPVSNLQYGKLWLAITELIGDEFFDEAARPMRPGSYQLLCQAVLHAGTLERALRRALLFLAVVLDDPVGELRLREGQAEIVLRDLGPPRRAFAYRTYWLILLGVMCWLIGRRIPLMQVDFACPAPENRRDYHQFFGAPVHFDQPVSRLSFAAGYLSLPTIRGPPPISCCAIATIRGCRPASAPACAPCRPRTGRISIASPPSCTCRPPRCGAGCAARVRALPPSVPRSGCSAPASFCAKPGSAWPRSPRGWAMANPAPFTAPF